MTFSRDWEHTPSYNIFFIDLSVHFTMAQNQLSTPVSRRWQLVHSSQDKVWCARVFLASAAADLEPLLKLDVAPVEEMPLVEVNSDTGTLEGACVHIPFLQQKHVPTCLILGNVFSGAHFACLWDFRLSRDDETSNGLFIAVYHWPWGYDMCIWVQCGIQAALTWAASICLVTRCGLKRAIGLAGAMS